MSAPALKSSSKADASRQRILDAAAQLFRDHGYAAVNLREIAARAGMKAGSLYYHFDSKEVIVAEILDTGIRAVHEGVEAAISALPADSGAEVVIHTAMLNHLRSLFEHSHYTSANVRIYNQVPPAIRKGNLKVRRAYERLWDGLLQKLADSGALKADVDIKHLRLLIISAMNASMEWFTPRRGSLTALADSYAAMLLHGVLEG